MRRNKIQRILLAAHKESQDSEARLKLALEGSESGVWDWQASQLNIYQPRLVNELGYEDDSVSLDDYLEKIHPQERAIFRLEWLEFLSNYQKMLILYFQPKMTKNVFLSKNRK